MAAALMTRARVSMAVACAALAAGCAAPKPPQPVPRVLQIHVQAASTLNPDARGRPTPVVIRVYELRATQTFQSADFFALFDKDQATLGNELASREELQLRPGESLALPPRDLKPDIRAVGVFAAFRDLEKSQWRSFVALPLAPPPTPTPAAKPVPVSVRVTLDTREVRTEIQ